MNNKKQLKDYYENNFFNIDNLIDDFLPYVRKVIDNYSMDTLSAEDKEEILSDTFFIIWKNRDKEIILLDQYLAGIAKNLIKEKYKKKNINVDISEVENVLGYYDKIDLFSDERELIENLDLLIKNIKQEDYQILNLFYYNNKSIKEISEELEISESNVTTRLYRIRKKLRKMFDERR